MKSDDMPLVEDKLLELISAVYCVFDNLIEPFK